MSDLEEAEEAAQHDLHEERRRTEQVVVPDILRRSIVFGMRADASDPHPSRRSIDQIPRVARRPAPFS